MVYYCQVHNSLTNIFIAHNLFFSFGCFYCHAINICYYIVILKYKVDKSKYLLYMVAMDINSLFSFLATAKKKIVGKIMFTVPNLMYQHGNNNLIGCSWLCLRKITVKLSVFFDTGFSNSLSPCYNIKF